MSSRPLFSSLFLVVAFATASLAGAATPADLLAQWRNGGATGGTAADAAFSAARGRQLFERRASDWSCSSCHTLDPRSGGKHVVTGKAILPLAPAANPQRFTDEAKVEKWFRRNCKDVLSRECTATEKGDVLTYLVSLK
jgi:mono/diheme cytochrome c family protein